MAQNLRDLIPGYDPRNGLAELIPGSTPYAPAPTLRSPDVQAFNDVADAAAGNAFTNSYQGARFGAASNRAAEEETGLRAAGGAENLLRADQLRTESLGLQQRAQAYRPKTMTYEDVMEQGITSVPGYLAAQVGQGLGSSVNQMAVGTAMGAAGGLLSLAPNKLISGAGKALRNYAAPATMYKMNADQLTGEAYNTVADDPVAMQRSAQDIDDEVRLHGYRGAVLDTAGQLLPVGRATGMFGKTLAGASKPALFAGGMLLEGATETGQNISQNFAHEALNPNRDTSGDFSGNMNSFLGGAAGGAGMNALGHVAEAGLERLTTKGDGKNGDRISLVDGMKAAESGVSHEDQAAKVALMRGDASALDMAADDYEVAASQMAGKRKAALLEELSKSKLPDAAKWIAKVNAVDESDPENAFSPTLSEAFNAVIPKAGLMSPEELTSLSRGKKMKSAQVAGTEIEKHEYATGPSQSRLSTLTGKGVPSAGTPGVESAVDPKKLTDTKVEMLSGPLKPLATDEVTSGVRKTSAPTKPADADDHAERSSFNNKLLWQSFNEMGANSSLPVNRAAKDVMEMFGDELAAMASQGVRENPTPAETQRALTIGRALATMLGEKASTVLETIAERNGVKLMQKQETVAAGVHLSAPVNESPVFQAAYDRAVELSDGSVTHQSEAISRGEKVQELVRNVPINVAAALLDEGVNLHSPKVGHYLLNAIEALSQGDERQRTELNKRFTKPVVDKLVESVSSGAPIEARNVTVKSVSGKTAATDADTAGVNESEADSTAYEKAQAQKSLDKSPPETLVFHHKRGVGTVTKLKDAFRETSTGRLPALVREGDTNTVPDGKGGSQVESIARVLRNATKTLRGRNGTWSLGRNHVMRAATALEVMDSANINDGKREQLMFRYLEQEGGPDVTDLKNMLGVVKSLEAYDRQYTAATIKRETVSPKGGKLSMVEADELAHPGGSQGTLDKLAGLAATPEDAALVLSTFKMDTASRNTALMGVVRRAKARALEQLTKTNGFRSFVATTQTNESRTPEFKELVNHFFSKRQMVVAEHKSDGDYLKMDLATFSTMAHDGLDLLKTSANIGRKSKGNAAFKAAARIRAEHEMGLLRWYHSDYSTSEPGKGDFDDKSARVVIQAKDLVAWVREQEKNHTIGKDKSKVRGENFGETRKNEDFLRLLTQGIMALVDQGLVRDMPYIINGQVHDTKNPMDEERGFAGEDGEFELYTKKGGKVDLTKVNAKDLAGREEWFEKEGVVKDTQGLKKKQEEWAKRAVEETLDVVGPMPTEARMSFSNGIPPSLDLGGRSYKEMVSARKAGYELAEKQRVEFEESQGPRNRAMTEKLAQDKHDADVAGIDFDSRKDLLDEDEMTSQARREAEAEGIDNTDMQSQEQQAAAEAEVEGASQFADEREHIEMMTGVLKAASDRAVRPLTPQDAFGLAGADIAAGLRKDILDAGPNQAKLTDAIQRVMAYARSVNRLKSAPKDTLMTADSTKAIEDDMLLGGHHYIAPLAMLLTPKFMAEVAEMRKLDLPLFEHLRSFTANNMLMQMVPDPMSGIPELGGAKLATLISALSGKTDSDKQVELDGKPPTDPDQAAQWEKSKATRLKWASQDISSAGRDTFLKGLTLSTTGKPAVRKRARFVGTSYESIASRYEASAERISNERIAKGEEKLEALRAAVQAASPDSTERRMLAAKAGKLSKAIEAANSSAGLAQANAKATGAQTQQVSVTGTAPTPKLVGRKTPELVGPKPAYEALTNSTRTTSVASSLSQETVDLQTEEVNETADALSAGIGKLAAKLKAKPMTAKAQTPAGLLASPPAAPAAHQAKETAKLAGADLVLAPTSTPGYAGDLGRAAQAEDKLLIKVTPDVAGKVVLVSVPGKGRGFTAMPTLIARVMKALDNGATVRTDNQTNAERDWNKDGEGALRAALIDAGYVETPGPEFSSWAKEGGETRMARGEAAALTPSEYGTIEADGTVTPAVMKNAQATPVESATTAAPTAPPKFNEIMKARAWLKKVLGPDVNVMMEEAFPDMDWNGDWDAAKNLLRIATANPIGIMTVAHHEAVHALFSKIMAKSPEARELLENAFGTPQMRKRLASLLTVKHDGSDAAKAKSLALRNLMLGDSAESREERVAYGFQFYKMGMLTIDKKPEGFFEKVQALMRKVFGAVRDSEKALAILESFDAGKLAEPSAAGLAIQAIMQTGEWRNNMLKRFDKQAQATYNEVMTNEQVGLNMGIEEAAEMTRMWFTNVARPENADKPGVINRTQPVTRQFHNRLDLALEDLGGADADADLKALGEALNNHTTPALAHIAKAKRAVQALLKQYHEYAREAGLDIGERFGSAGDKEYYPRVMDLEYLVDNKDAFLDMLTKNYAHVLKAGKASLATLEKPEVTEADVAQKIYENFVNREGVDDGKLAVSREDGILNPLFNAGEMRKLHWISDEHMAPFLSTNVVATLTQYLRQGVRAAEYTRSFGRGGEQLRDMMARKGEMHPVEGAAGKVRLEAYAEDGPILTALKAKAASDKIPVADREAWVERRMEDLERMNGAFEGSLGKDISPKYRKFQGAVMTMQSLRLLPFMLFSSMMDPNSIRVAGGTNQDMFDAYKRGFGAVWDNWKDMLLGNPANMRDMDADEMAALEAGAIDNLVRLESMGTVASSEYSAGITREINHKFFRAIGITHWDRAMRIMAVRAARRSIASMIRGDSKEHSARWLKEVGLTEGQGTVNAEGMLITTRRELAAQKNISLEEAARELVPIHAALNRWVNRAIVSPNAGLRPTRASDPHFAMFYQFKSFTYAFQETTMRYALREAAHGNMEASARLLVGVPIMIVSDMAKAMVLGGGSLPSYMANWTMADWVGHGINRALGTTVQMGTEAISDPLSLFGPTVGQAGDVLAAPLQGEVLKTALDAVPGLRYARGAIDGALTLKGG